MAETKRISDQYSIISPIINIGNASSHVTIDGNLTVTGTTTSVETTNSQITDNTIVLNEGETGAGVTLGTSGIEVDRGTLNNVSFVFDDSIDAFKIFDTSTTNLLNLRVAEPVNTSDATTKNYVDIVAASSLTLGGNDTSVQFNDGGSDLGGDLNFTYDGFNVNIGDTTINSGSIFTNSTNSDLEVYANGSGTVYLRSVVKLENELSDPSGVSGNNLLYAKTPGVGDSGVYFSNTDHTDELVSKRKAVFFGLIF